MFLCIVVNSLVDFVLVFKYLNISSNEYIEIDFPLNSGQVNWDPSDASLEAINCLFIGVLIKGEFKAESKTKNNVLSFYLLLLSHTPSSIVQKE